MFTIKNVVSTKIRHYRRTSEGLTTRLWEGRNVRSEIPDQGPMTVVFDEVDGGTWTLSSGVVYVMNAAGRTVETFHLNDAPVEKFTGESGEGVE